MRSHSKSRNARSSARRKKQLRGARTSPESHAPSSSPSAPSPNEERRRSGGSSPRRHPGWGLKAFLRALDSFWFDRADPFSLALFRISLGSLMLVTLLCLLPNWERYYGAAGVLSLVDPRFQDGQDAWSCFYWTDGILPVHVWWLVGVVGAVGMTVGWSTRFWTIVLYVLQCSMIHRNRMAVNGEDLVYRMVLFYSCFATLDRDLSLAAWWNRTRLAGSGAQPIGAFAQGPSSWPSNWPVRLMQINIALIYVFSLPDKLLTDPAWLDGTALYFVMINSHWGRWPWPWMFYSGALSKVATYTAIAMEGAFPILVWLPRTRVAITVTMALFHLGIAVCLQNVTFFSLAMVAALWVFVPGDRSRRWFERLRRAVSLQPERGLLDQANTPR